MYLEKLEVAFLKNKHACQLFLTLMAYPVCREAK